MADISQEADPVVGRIYEHYEKTYGAELARTYLGASVIGSECARALWYAFRWASPKTFDGRMYRLFQTGHLEEPRMIADLRAIGATVYDRDPATGDQFNFKDLHGHMRGSMDGCASNLPHGGRAWHVLEFKTHSAKSFATLKKDGVQKAKPQHYVQMQVYMGWSGMERALYLGKNKDTDELYSERIKFDRTCFEQSIAKAERIIFGAEPPAKISEDPKFYLCNWCEHNAVCHGHQVPAKSCRTCCHSTPAREGMEGDWTCASEGKAIIPVPTQRTGCRKHLPLPYLLTYAAPIDAGEGWIMFRRKDNEQHFVVHAEGVEAVSAWAILPHYTSAEVSAAADHRAIGDSGIEEFRTTFGAKIVG